MNILKGGILEGKKTYLVSITGIITSITGYLIGDLDLANLFSTIFPLFSIMFLRKSITTKDAE